MAAPKGYTSVADQLPSENALVFGKNSSADKNNRLYKYQGGSFYIKNFTSLTDSEWVEVGGPKYWKSTEVGE